MRIGEKMAEIQYSYYIKKGDYPDNPVKQDTMDISKHLLGKYSILNGKFNGYSLNKKEKDFYSSFYKIALEENSNKMYVCSSAYQAAEPSYKTIISFALGMLATRTIATKKYNVVHLFHLKDQSIQRNPPKGQVPDWFGIDKHGKAFLFESKGSVETSISPKTLKNAKKQLTSVKSITVKWGNGQFETYIAAEIEKHAIVSCFRYDHQNNVRNKWNFHDIDPEGEAVVDITINLDKECFKYYRAFLDFLDSYKKSYEENVVMIDQQKYCFLEDGAEKFGIHKGIYDAVVSKKYTEENDYINFYEDIKKILSEIKCDKYMEDSSSYEDGIIVCSSEKNF